MPLIEEGTKSKLRERFAGLQGPVELRLYLKPHSGRLILPGGMGCPTCSLAEELARAVADAAPERVTLSVIDVMEQPDERIEVPTLTIGAPGEEARIAFQGLPSGYEFSTLLDAIERVSSKGGSLAPDLTDRLSKLDTDVEVMVFVTPTCPYCPGAASMANRMALTSPRVRSVVVQANEFAELSRRFQVEGVPRTVVNRAGSFVGALPETMFVESVLQLAARETA
jgi:glutaredoxin-like protein